MSDGLPSKQTVNAVGGRLQAREVAVGTRLWTLDGSRAAQTTVTDVTAVKARAVVDVVTSHAAFTVAGHLLLATPSGWVRAEDATGRTIAWTHARKLCRERLTFRMGYAFGYFVGATCADGTVGKNYVSLVVNDEAFATRYARSLTEATGLAARLQPVTRPSGYLGREIPGFRVRVVSSYLADALRQYAGGDAHHMRQAFPRVVLRDREVFDGFLDGYADGDGCRAKRWAGRTLVSANVPFLVDLVIPRSWSTGIWSARRRDRRGGLVHRAAGPVRRYAAAAPVPSWSLPSSGRRQTRSRKSAAAMTAMPATTAAPA